MPTEENKAIVRRGYEEVWNQGDLEATDEIFATDFVLHTMYGDIHHPEGFKEYVSAVRAAFPDLHFAIEDQIAEGDKVVTCWTLRGTHLGEIEIEDVVTAPTGKRVTVRGVSIDHIAAGKSVETWILRERLSPQLGFRLAPPQEQGEE
jgi:predicted ester cyclase